MIFGKGYYINQIWTFILHVYGALHNIQYIVKICKSKIILIIYPFK